MKTTEVITLRDSEIRSAYHRKYLRDYHDDPRVLVVDELGLQHGKCRADIAVMNGRLAAYEIKSDLDSLSRLHSQVHGYNAVFDRITLVVTQRHLQQAATLIPPWWGLVSTARGKRGGIHFTTVRRSQANPEVDSFCVAQLLWREEAREILLGLGLAERELRGNRAELYDLVVKRLSPQALRHQVREKMKSRSNWKGPSQP
ncbi:MAG: sce7726 family protein [Thermoleophilia bacterium]|nr:sce7726 family protein [Thermoleophilia bacterium]